MLLLVCLHVSIPILEWCTGKQSSMSSAIWGEQWSWSWCMDLEMWRGRNRFLTYCDADRSWWRYW
jgi:hypothetical protein